MFYSFYNLLHSASLVAVLAECFWRISFSPSSECHMMVVLGRACEPLRLGLTTRRALLPDLNGLADPSLTVLVSSVGDFGLSNLGGRSPARFSFTALVCRPAVSFVSSYSGSSTKTSTRLLNVFYCSTRMSFHK